ncbi:MAG TPA: TonB-dependent receptor [Pyrinomonadaceae bacterium]|nr:TonB-dependent receptor [Pyrinomonadaceae bacterium]
MNRSTSRLIRVILCGLFLLSFVSVANAQFKAGIQGTVTDSSGGLVPEAKVTVSNNETSKSQTATASEEGFYRISGLSPGLYTVTAEKGGFKKQVFENVTVNAESTLGLDIVLTTGEIAETVTVTEGTTEQLQTENANVSKAITTREIQQLPQPGRDPYELLRLAPGVFGTGARAAGGQSLGFPNGPGNDPNVAGPGGSNTSVFQTENQVPISANGQRVSNNTYTIDGVSVNSLGFGGAAVVTPNQESVKEVRVLSSSYSAEDGRNSGAQVKVVSQNGTNDFHGSAFYKYNDPNLNSFNKFGDIFGGPDTRVENRFRQFGASLGGPIPIPQFGEGPPPAFKLGRNKAFFFFSFEALRNKTNNPVTKYVETPEFRALVQQLRPGSVTSRILASSGMEPRIVSALATNCGIFGNDANRCRVVTGGIDIGSPTGAVGQYIGFGNPTGGGFDGIPDLQLVQLADPDSTRGLQFNPRFDFNSGANQFALSLYRTQLENVNSDVGAQGRPAADLVFKPVNSAATFTWNRIFNSTTFNEARVNFTRFHANQVQSSVDTNFGIPRVEIEGLPLPGGDRIRLGAERAETTPGIFAQNTYEVSDTLSKVVGNHGLKIGGLMRREQDNNSLVGGARPLYSFNGLFNFANDTPIFEAVNTDPRTGGPADAQRYFRTEDYAGFIQDDWKARPNLTLNLGLRYEYFTPLKEKEGHLAALRFGSQGLRDSHIEIVDQFFEPDRNNFGPRFGFAYSPNFGDSFNGLLKENKAVIRGGAGIQYNRIPNVLFANSRGNPPFFARNNICCGNIASEFGTPFVDGRILYALGANNSPFSYPANPLLGAGIDPVSGGVLNNEVEIYGTDLKVPNSYVYLYSLELQYELPANMVGTIGYQGSSAHKLIRIVNENLLFTRNPRFNPVYFIQPDVNSNFNALNARLERRLSAGLQFGANYRFSKSIDTLSYEGPGGGTNQTNPGDLASERGPSDFDARHSFNFSGLYELPFYRNRRDVAGKILGGFQLSGIVTANSGYPFTPKLFEALRQPSGEFFGPIRPTGYFGGASDDTSNDAFLRPGGIFPGGGALYFPLTPGAPGIGRNSFRGPRYFSIDMSVVKQTGLPNFLSEAANLELRVNFFNVFNQLNLQPIRFFDDGSIITSPNFGRSTRGLSGRVIELQARFRF